MPHWREWRADERESSIPCPVPFETREAAAKSLRTRPRLFEGQRLCSPCVRKRDGAETDLSRNSRARPTRNNSSKAAPRLVDRTRPTARLSDFRDISGRQASIPQPEKRKTNTTPRAAHSENRTATKRPTKRSPARWTARPGALRRRPAQIIPPGRRQWRAFANIQKLRR